MAEPLQDAPQTAHRHRHRPRLLLLLAGRPLDGDVLQPRAREQSDFPSHLRGDEMSQSDGNEIRQVYVVTSGCYSDYGIESVWLTMTEYVSGGWKAVRVPPHSTYEEPKQ